LRSFPPVPDEPRPIRARGPRGSGGLRDAYLELLKLSLCDLVGAETRMVAKDDHGVFSRPLVDEQQLSWRVDGSDWPLNGLTMVGLRRLDDLQARIEQLVADRIEGDLIEAGAWRGGASILMRATLDSLGDDRELWVADSFQGFPQPESGTVDDTLETDVGAIDYFAPGLEAVKGYFERFGVGELVRFVPGFFEQTMAGLGGRRWALIRLDADGYNATRLVLDTLYGGLARGGYVVIDDYFTPGLDVCRDAVDGFRSDHGIEDEITRIDWTGARWRKTAEPDLGGAVPAPARSRARAPWPKTGDPIPTDRERLLEWALDEHRERIADLESQLESAREEARRKAARWRLGRGD
jgi:Macrocin-O-methyltransferase (TylF)